ncbi:Lrp/AsnC family transcriptional regulator [Dyella halodurans]|uniref:Lrp/AsnC family transcriptional regulator n=1 Tax=Dyella halodurans TaxID=1920171 RepID=A0ABV9C018_9GAMM|nr:Lrp/AsnC family transcriptional regulator [Dyella halodurans]
METTESKLDSFDVRILQELQERGDLTMAELAERVYRSNSQCSRRVKQLQDMGVIRRYAAVLDPEKLGLKLKAYVTVVLKQHSEEAATFHQLVRDCPEIMECSMVTGDGDYLLKTYTRDIPHFRELLGKLVSIELVGTLKSIIVVDDLKETSALPVYAQ